MVLHTLTNLERCLNLLPISPAVYIYNGTHLQCLGKELGEHSITDLIRLRANSPLAWMGFLLHVSMYYERMLYSIGQNCREGRDKNDKLSSHEAFKWLLV